LPHGNNQFFLRLTAIIDFSLPHSKNQFHPPDGDSRLTAISIFSSPHGDNRFFLCLTARIDFIPPYGDSRPITGLSIFSSPHGNNRFFFASRQESISFA
jgi:hypothetical protein